MNGDDRRASEERADDERAGEALRLDGNAAAGILSEVFVPDLTTAHATCAGCGQPRCSVHSSSTLMAWARSYVVQIARLSCCASPARRRDSGSTQRGRGSW